MITADDVLKVNATRAKILERALSLSHTDTALDFAQPNHFDDAFLAAAQQLFDAVDILRRQIQ